MNRLRCASYRPQRSRAKDRLGRLRGDQLGKRGLPLLIASALWVICDPLQFTNSHSGLELFSLLN
jgi:hypothetical protein